MLSVTHFLGNRVRESNEPPYSTVAHHSPLQARSQTLGSKRHSIVLSARGAGGTSRMKLAACALVLFAASLSAASQQAPAQPIAMKGPTIGAVMFPHSAHTHGAGKCEV
jgi:hypothetical protein